MGHSDKEAKYCNTMLPIAIPSTAQTTALVHVQPPETHGPTDRLMDASSSELPVGPASDKANGRSSLDHQNCITEPSRHLGERKVAPSCLNTMRHQLTIGCSQHGQKKSFVTALCLSFFLSFSPLLWGICNHCSQPTCNCIGSRCPPRIHTPPQQSLY